MWPIYARTIVLVFAMLLLQASSTAVAQTTVEVRVNSSSDDAEEVLSTGAVSLTSGDLELGVAVDGTNTTAAGFRFQNVLIPSGSTITNAYIQFKCDETGSSATSLTIFGQDVDNAATFSTSSHNLSSRTTTSATAVWSPAAWNTVGQAGANQRTPNLTTIIQEIVDRAGWASGNAMALGIYGSGVRIAESYDGDNAGAPLLHIEYTAPASSTAHWKFDEGSGSSLVDSLDDNDAAFSTGTPTRVEGKRGEALQFNGSNAADTNSNFTPPATGSVAFWYRFNATPSGAQRLMGLGGDWEVRTDASGIIYADLGCDGAGFGYQTPAGSAAAGEWHHFVAIYNSSADTFSLYLDAQLVASGTGSISSQSAAILSFGTRTGSTERYNGALDDVRIYDYELSFSEVVELYGLVGHWTFDEGTGTDIADSSLNANDASFNTGTPSWVAGVRGNALQFNGSNDADTDANFDPPANGTIAFWYRFSDEPSGTQRLVGRGDDWEVRVDSSGVLYCDIGGVSSGFETPADAARADVWHHLAAVYSDEDNDFTLYLDGAIVASGSMSISDQSANQLSFGTRTGSTERFEGALDDVRVYSYELSAKEVAELYGLIGHWRLDETNGVTAADTTVLENDGSYESGATLDQDGIRERAVELDGANDHIVVGHDSSLDVPETFSIALWVKAETLSDWKGLVVKGTGLPSAANYSLLMMSNGQMKLGAGGTYYNATTPIEEGEWHHLAVTYDGSYITFFLDGQQDNQFSASPTLVENNQPLYIGLNSFSSAAFEGHIDDVRLYNRAISEQEIAVIHGLVGHWKLDETVGSMAIDSTGLANEAALTGTSGWTAGPLDGAHEHDYTNGDDYFEVPSSDVLDHVNEESYSLSAWFKPLSVPPGSGSDNDACYGILIKAGWHIGLYYTSDQTFEMTNYLDGHAWEGAGTAPDTFPPGKFYHVASVVNRTAGTAEIYIDGVLLETNHFTPGATLQDYGSEPWRIGIASPGAGSWRWATDGVIDDVRIYNRAILPEEVESLHSSGVGSSVRITKWIEIQ